MLKTKKQKSIITLVAATALSCGMAIAFSANHTMVAKADTFNSFTMAGAQLRVDDAGLRFVMEMGADTYATYSKDSAYTSGVLVIPEWLLGDEELEIVSDESLNYENIQFDAEYIPYATENAYRFNAVLKGIPDTQYGTKLCARGYIMDDSGAVVAYTDTITRNVSYVASEYVDDYAEETAEYQNVESYIVKAYNSLTGENATSFEEMQMTLTMNDINTIMANNENGAYSNEVKTVLEELFPVSYAVSEETENIAVDGETGIITANAKGVATVEATACCGKLSVSYDLTVMDNVLWNVGSGYSNGVYKEYANARDFFAAQMTIYANAQIAGKKSIIGTETVEYVEEKAGKANLVAYTTQVSNLFLQPRLEYTKEEIKTLLDFGYDRLIIPVYVEVDSANIPAELTAGLDRMDVWTPNSKITDTDEKYCGYRGYNNQIAHYTQRSLFFNQWNDVTLSLQLIYDNYEEFTKHDVYASGSPSWTLLSIQLMTQNNQWVNFEKTFYFGNATVAQNTFVAETEAGYAIDFTAPDVLDKIVLAQQNATAAASTDFAVGMYGRVDVTSGTIAGKTGTFLTLTNIDYARGGVYEQASNTASKRGNATQSLFFGSIMTKEQLLALKDAGYTKMSFNVNRQVVETAYSVSGTDIAQPYINSRDNLFDSNRLVNEKAWTKVEISLQTLIDQYDNFFTDSKPYCIMDPSTNKAYTDTTKYHHSIFQLTNMNDYGEIVSVYVADLMFVKQ